MTLTGEIVATFDAACALHGEGRLGEASRLCERILEADPDRGDVLNLLSDIAFRGRDFAVAERFARRAVDADPGDFSAHNSLGNALSCQGKVGEAIASFERAIAERGEPDARLYFNLGNAHRNAGRLRAAADNFREAVRLDSACTMAWSNLGAALLAANECAEAVRALARAARLEPSNPAIQFNLGNAHLGAGDLDRAANAYRAAIAIEPDYAEAWTNLGRVEVERGEMKAAETCFRTAIRAQPDLAEAYVGLADLAPEEPDEAVGHRRAVLALNPNLASVRSSLLMCMHYHPEFSVDEIRDEHLRYGEVHEAALAPRKPPRPADRRSRQRPRVGFVSADFRFHAIASFVLPLLRAREPGAWEAICYSNTPKTNAYTDAFRAASDLWRDVSALSEAELAACIRSDEVDILFDLSGHAPGNRLLAFARKPAPLQVGWMYVNTRGLEAMDYLIADRWHVPAGEESQYPEGVVRMPHGYACFAPAEHAPAVAPAPVLANGYLTFGSFSEITKINAQCVALWARALEAVPSARFVLNNFLLEKPENAERMARMFTQAGIARERITFLPGGPHREFLAQYATVDVILDTTPYSGGLTTCEALWQGVPTVTLTGERFCGRHSTSHLMNVGLANFVTSEPEGFIAAAVALAQDHAGLGALRSVLRSRVAASALGDAEAFARDFTRALRLMSERSSEHTAGRRTAISV